MYKIEIEKKVLDFLYRIPKSDARHFQEKLTIIAQDPYASIPFAKKLTGMDGYRFRFGNYRAVYTIKNDILTVCVIAIGHRKEVYRR